MNIPIFGRDYVWGLKLGRNEASVKMTSETSLWYGF